MKTYRILGILWIGLCGFTAISVLRAIPRNIVFLPESYPKPIFYFQVLFECLFFLAVAIASLFLFISGAKWARIFVGVIGILGAIRCIIWIVKGHYMSEWGVIVGIFDLVSGVILFWPRREPVG